MTTLNRRVSKKWSFRMGALVALAAIAVAAVFVVSSNGAVADGGGRQQVTGRASGVFTGPTGGMGTFKAQSIGQGDVVFSNLATDPAGAFPFGDFVCVPITGGDQTFTVANGDALNMVFVSGDICVDSAGLPASGSFETHVTGGTGQFRRARGVIFIDAEGRDRRDSAVSSFPNWTSRFERASWIKVRCGDRDDD